MSELGDRLERTTSSMLWSAWADALGWISELTSAANLRRRTKGRPLIEPFAWQRQIGGRMGVRVDLPAGCYSDDTQLRLATARAISSFGFDVEAFARVELPVWQSYALGGGRASKAAATAMSKQNANWAANFYKGWESAGGNGAAMRIQPHVYAASNLLSFEHLDDVIKNSIVTHGHPNGIVGAVLHAIALTLALEQKRAPGPDDWPDIIGVARESISAFYRYPELSAYWRPRWEEASGEKLEIAWHRTLDDVEDMLRSSIAGFQSLEAAGGDPKAASQAYEFLVRTLGLDEESTRGSGLATATAAMLLAGAIPDDPARAAQLASSRLDTDTDTIATMAAAIIGSVSIVKLPSQLLDADYIASEAERLTLVAYQESTNAFPYPDLLRWAAPKTGLDSVGIADGNIAVAGLGWSNPYGDIYSSGTGNWQWMTTSFGPSMLLKHRSELPVLLPSNWPNYDRLRPPFPSFDSPVQRLSTMDQTLFDLPVRTEERGVRVAAGSPQIELNVILEWLHRRGHDDQALGYALRRVAESGTDAQLAQFAAEVARELRRPNQR